jgi:predicted acyl esterase
LPCLLAAEPLEDATNSTLPTYPWQLIKTYISIPHSPGSSGKIKLAVTFGVPIPTSSAALSTVEFPVLVEYLPYRKDDSMYPLRYNYIEYFASRGFLYAYVDIRGTGGSEGDRIPFEYSRDIEIEDYINVIQLLGDPSQLSLQVTRKGHPGGTDRSMTVRSNGRVGLWGTSWSACSSFVVAGLKARDSRLDALKTIVPVHCGVDLYKGDIHYLDGILHLDEYILSVDHETILPSYGFDGAGSVDAYPLDAAYNLTRWNAMPWAFVYLQQQLNDGWWRNRTAFFNGPFTDGNPDDFSLPTFAIGSLLDGYRDAAVQIYDKLRAKNVPAKLAMSPSVHTLPDQATPGPLWDWKEEAAKWLHFFLVEEEEDSADPTLRIEENEVALYMRLPGDDSRQVPGYWRNEAEGPHMGNDKVGTYYLTVDHGLSLSNNSTTTTTRPLPHNNNKSNNSAASTTHSLTHSLKYEPSVGVEMGTWYGEASLGDMAPLDAKSLVYDLDVWDLFFRSNSEDEESGGGGGGGRGGTGGATTAAVEFFGIAELHLRAAVISDDVPNLDLLQANWHVRLEDVSTADGRVSHITGASINGAHRDSDGDPSLSPSALRSGTFYDFTIKLHYSTWTFVEGHTLRVAITNALWPMMWPSPHNMHCELQVSNAHTYILLPLQRVDLPRRPGILHPYRAGKHTIGWSEPADGWYYSEGGYPYELSVKTENGSTTKVWKGSYFTNCYGWIVSVELGYTFSQSVTVPWETQWRGYARHVYQYIGTSDKALWEVDRWGYPLLTRPTDAVPPVQRQFTLETWLDVTSGAQEFFSSLSRTLTSETGQNLMPPFAVEMAVPRQFQ